VNDEALGTLSKYRRWRAKAPLSLSSVRDGLPGRVGDSTAEKRAWPLAMVRRPWRSRQSRRQRRGARVSGERRSLHLPTFSRPDHAARKSPTSMA